MLAVVLVAAGIAAAIVVTRGMQRGTAVAANVNGEVIYSSDLEREVAALARQYNIDLNSENGRKQRAEINKIVLDQVIEQRLILQEARRLGAEATTQQLDEAMTGIKRNFPTPAEFEMALAQRGLTEAALRDRLRTNITVQNVAAKVSTATVTEEEIQKQFQANRAQYDKPEQVHVRHILVESDAEARFALARLNRGEKFEDLARQLSKDPGSKEQGGDLGFVSKGQLVPEFERAAFALQRPGELSPVVKTQYGYHVIQFVARTAAQPAVLETVRNQIRRELLGKKQEADFQAWVKQLKVKAKITRSDTAPK
jgi:parvulin-like peptidyl-prolyl isomerase